MARKKRRDHDEDAEAPPSKSQRKREMHSLQALGKELAELSQAQFQRLLSLRLDPDLAEALQHYREIDGHEAKRRQLQYIGKVMRNVETVVPLREFLQGLDAVRRQEAALQRAVESERDALIAGGDNADAVLRALTRRYGEDAAREAERLAEEARNEHKHGRKPAAFRQLYRHLRDIAMAGPRTDDAPDAD